MKTSIKQIKDKALPILKEAGVRRSSLFGSYVRGENKKGSDIDILVDLPRGKSLFDLVGLKLRLEEVLKNKVDIGTYNSIDPLLKERILKEQIQIL